MQSSFATSPATYTGGGIPLLKGFTRPPAAFSRCLSPLRHKWRSTSKSVCAPVGCQASNVGLGSSAFDGKEEGDSQKKFDVPANKIPHELGKPTDRIPYPLSIALVLLGCAVVYSLIMFVNIKPSSILAAISKSGFTAAFSLIFVSEIGDKTFFIAALLAMQYEKALVLLGSMGALSLMTILSVMLGRIFHSVPTQFQTTLPIGEYAAVALLVLFGLKSIKDAWELPSDTEKTGDNGPELDEYAQAEELVKEKVSKRLTNPLEILWKSFSLVFFAEWGDRSMLATIALGAAQSPWGVASGAIVGHLIATSVAVLGGAFLAKLATWEGPSFSSLLWRHSLGSSDVPRGSNVGIYAMKKNFSRRPLVKVHQQESFYLGDGD
ncbi:PAM71-homolog, chloroplastic-like protein [Drosera capensis]